MGEIEILSLFAQLNQARAENFLFFFALFKSHIGPARFSLLRSQMDKFTRAK
jgi:hypothetical protein